MKAQIVSRNRLILVIDDDPSSYRGILRLSESLQSDVCHFTCQTELLEWLQSNNYWLSNNSCICLIVLDCKFIDIFNDKFIEEFFRFPRIAISRSSSIATSLRLISAGNFEFIEMPFVLETMRTVLEQAFCFQSDILSIESLFKRLTKREYEIC